MKPVTRITIATLIAMSIECQAQTRGNEGATIFNEQCAGCHGPNGKAQTDIGKTIQAADLTSNTVQQMNESELIKTVKSGNKKMPAFEGKLNNDEIEAVVGYLRKLGQGK